MTQRTDDAIATIRFEVASLQADLRDAREALEAITIACELDCAGPLTDTFHDDEPVGGGLDGSMALTFGVIRRARSTLAKLDAKP